MQESYELNGLQIRSISLPWAPYLIQTECADTDEFGSQNCKNEGYLIDFMESARKRFNFTYISLRYASNDWGTKPKSGPFNMSGTWGGVMGGVINGEYDTSLSAWYWIYSRVELLSFAPVVTSR